MSLKYTILSEVFVGGDMIQIPDQFHGVFAWLWILFIAQVFCCSANSDQGTYYYYYTIYHYYYYSGENWPRCPVLFFSGAVDQRQSCCSPKSMAGVGSYQC